MTRTEGDGNSSPSIARMSSAWSAKLAWPSSSPPGKPPPMSKSVGMKPCRSISSNTALALTSAFRKAPTCVQRLPTWKLTPTTERHSSLALASSAPESSTFAPNLFDNGHFDWASSVCTLSNSSALGWSLWSLSSSASLSKTPRRTPAVRAKTMADSCLQGLAYTVCFPRSAPRAVTIAISGGLAQSKPPVPHSCHTLQSARSSAGWPLHFTA
mmetsp:Transcript_101753/g.283322  ORF Transcript_101753/g.283322 Transcript_101753/m.283322 type:complete len:213 (+) Transcript_101753:555-1193(+)